MQTMIPAVFDRKAFDAIVKQLADEDACALALTDPERFRACFDKFGDATGHGPATKPGPAKTKPPAVDFETIKSQVRETIRHRPSLTAAEIRKAIEPVPDGRIVKRALAQLRHAQAIAVDTEGRYNGS